MEFLFYLFGYLFLEWLMPTKPKDKKDDEGETRKVFLFDEFFDKFFK